MSIVPLFGHRVVEDGHGKQRSSIQIIRFAVRCISPLFRRSGHPPSNMTTSPKIYLGKSVLILRGFDEASHLSRDEVHIGEELALELEPENVVDKYAVRAITSEGEHVGRIAKWQSKGCSLVLRRIQSLGIQCRGRIIRFEREVYGATKIIIEVLFFIAEKDSSLQCQKARDLSEAVEGSGTPFSNSFAFPSNDSASTNQLVPRSSSLACENPLLRQLLESSKESNLQLQQLVATKENECANLSSKLDLHQKAGLLQRRLSLKIGDHYVIPEGCREGKMIPGVTWRLINVSIVYDENGDVVTGNRGGVVHDMIYQSLHDGQFKGWTKCERRAVKITAERHWTSADGWTCDTIDNLGDFVRWKTKNKKRKVSGKQTK